MPSVLFEFVSDIDRANLFLCVDLYEYDSEWSLTRAQKEEKSSWVIPKVVAVAVAVAYESFSLKSS